MQNAAEAMAETARKTSALYPRMSRNPRGCGQERQRLERLDDVRPAGQQPRLALPPP